MTFGQQFLCVAPTSDGSLAGKKELELSMQWISRNGSSNFDFISSLTSRSSSLVRRTISSENISNTTKTEVVSVDINRKKQQQ